MTSKTSTMKNYTIRQAAAISGLPESTLRYYETIGIIQPIARDSKTKRRVYSDEDIDFIVAIACLNATGMSIDDMKTYLKNFQRGEAGAFSQVDILSRQLRHLEEENRLTQLRTRYVQVKIDFWKAVIKKDSLQADRFSKEISAIANQLNLPQTPHLDAKERNLQ